MYFIKYTMHKKWVFPNQKAAGIKVRGRTFNHYLLKLLEQNLLKLPPTAVVPK